MGDAPEDLRIQGPRRILDPLIHRPVELQAVPHRRAMSHFRGSRGRSIALA
jgi:hypothetical protein